MGVSMQGWPRWTHGSLLCRYPTRGPTSANAVEWLWWSSISGFVSTEDIYNNSGNDCDCDGEGNDGDDDDDDDADDDDDLEDVLDKIRGDHRGEIPV